jgi:hypothetical protein
MTDFFKDVPIVGQPITIVASEVTAIGYCTCRSQQKDQSFIWLAMMRTVFCQQCQTGFTLLGLTPDGRPNIQVTKQAGV